MGCFVLPIFNRVIMDEHPIFWVVDAGAAGIHQNKTKDCLILILSKKIIIIFVL